MLVLNLMPKIYKQYKHQDRLCFKNNMYLKH